MEEASEMMEVEEPKRQMHPNSIKRFGLKNFIPTNFGNDYVFQIVPKDDCSQMAVSLSTNVVKLYSSETGQFIGECKGHSGTINDLSFAGPSGPHVLHSCSSDGKLRAWDTRTFHEVSGVSASSSQEIFSFSFGGSTNNLLSTGCQSQILFWDWRSKKQVACLEESHTDDVIQVRFVPESCNELVSASVDGLICYFDTDGDINDDDNLKSVSNVGSSIGKVGFFGESYQKLWCLTYIETLSIWDWKDGRNDVNLQDARSLASDSWTLDHVDYFVDCYHSGDRLWVIGGTNTGSIGYFPVDYTGGGRIRSPEAILGGGHIGVVRSVLPMSRESGGPAQTRGIFGWTGGEDGRLCCWLSDDSNNINRSWISNELVTRSPRINKRNRHSPY